MIKFNTPEIKAQKIKDSIEILKNPKIQSSSLYGTTTTTPFVISNIGGVFPSTVNTNLVASGITSGSISITSTGTVGLGSTNPQSKLLINNNNNNTNFSSNCITAINGQNTITTGQSNIAIGSNTITTTGQSNTAIGSTVLNSNTIYGSYHSSTLFTTNYNLLGSDIVLPYLHNGEMIIALINTLGVEFWDEYVETVGFKLNNTESFNIIEGVMKLQRRDAKLDSIINDK